MIKKRFIEKTGIWLMCWLHVQSVVVLIIYFLKFLVVIKLRRVTVSIKISGIFCSAAVWWSRGGIARTDRNSIRLGSTFVIPAKSMLA